MANSRLSRIETHWSVVHKAHNSQNNGASAFAILVDRYGPAIKRYLLGSLKSEEAASEVFQEFALRLVNGDFKNASEHKGRFRNMIKTALYRLMIDYHRKQARSRKLNSGQPAEEIADHQERVVEDDEKFLISWRQSLLDETWSRLKELEQKTGQPYYQILKARTDEPRLTTKQLHRLLQSTGTSIPELCSFRVFLHRARKRFSTILLQLVIESLDMPSEEAVELELIELGLHHYCKPVIST